MSRTILYFGNERLATGVTTNVTVLNNLIKAGYDVRAIFVAQNSLSASRKQRDLEIEKVADSNNIPLLSPTTQTELADIIKGFNAEAAVLVAYGNIVFPEIIDLFPKGIINIHPSLLPKHRGPTPLESVILNGESVTGVSLMKLSEGLDNGPVYAAKEVKLNSKETKQELADKLLEIGAEILISNLPDILDGALIPTPQDESQATTDKKIGREDGILDWTKPAKELERQVRAYAEWPRSRTTLSAQDIIVTKASVSDDNGIAGEIVIKDNKIGVYSSDGLFIIESLIPIGKKEMTAQAFLAGHKL